MNYLLTMERAFRLLPSNHNAAQLLRAAIDAESKDYISDEGFSSIVCDVIEYLEGRAPLAPDPLDDFNYVGSRHHY